MCVCVICMQVFSVCLLFCVMCLSFCVMYVCGCLVVSCFAPPSAVSVLLSIQPALTLGWM